MLPVRLKRSTSAVQRLLPAATATGGHSLGCTPAIAARARSPHEGPVCDGVLTYARDPPVAWRWISRRQASRRWRNYLQRADAAVQTLAGRKVQTRKTVAVGPMGHASHTDDALNYRHDSGTVRAHHRQASLDSSKDHVHGVFRLNSILAFDRPTAIESKLQIDRRAADQRNFALHGR